MSKTNAANVTHTATSDSYANCELCGKPLPTNEIAASFTSDARTGLLAWCFDCWDYDERAVEQYRSAGDKDRNTMPPDVTW